MRENIGGGLAFEATLDINDFNVSSAAMERRIKDVSNTAVLESEKMEHSIASFVQNGARMIVDTLVAGGMTSLVNSIVRTRGEFQQLEIAFETMLGSGTKAQSLMNQMITTAAKTPFDLMGLASGAKQLMAYGAASDNVNDILVRLGNIASGLSIPLNDIVYLYGTTMVQGRLYAQDVRQFMGRGIPLVRELASMYGKTTEEINAMVTAGKIGFSDVEKVINKMTNSGGQFYNLMEKQAASLTGMISNLGDAWDVALNKLGKDNQDILSAGISGATYAVEHLDDVLRIVKAIAVAYGSYKAAIVVNTLATKGQTGVALIDNTVRQAKVALMKADEKLTGKAATITAKMTAAQEAHTLSLQKQLTVQEQENLAKQLRIATILQLLTAQQQEYLSNLNVTTSSANYEAVATSVLSVEQREALSKTDLSAKSAIYQAALEKEVLAKNQSSEASLNAMRSDVKAANVKMEAAKSSALMSMQAVESARYEVYWAKQSGDATRIAAAEKKLEGAIENQAISRKAALAASSEFYSKKKKLEATATAQSTIASAADTAVKGTQTAATSLLSVVTNKLSLSMKALWASMMSNPVGWVIGIFGSLVSVITMFRKKEEEAKTVEGEFQDAVKKSGDELRNFMSILQNTESGTNAHKKALEKVNAIAKEYNKTLLSENATLEEQMTKYEELNKAIQATTAEKIKAKYIEKAMAGLSDKQTEATSGLKKSASNASFTQVERGITYSFGSAMVADMPIKHAARNIQNASEAVWDGVESMAIDASKKLKNLTGSAYDQAFHGAVDSIMKKIQQSTGATDKEIDGFEKTVSGYLKSMTDSYKEASAIVDKTKKQVDSLFKTEPTTTVADSVDYLSMSFTDLDQKLKDTRAEINKINAKEVKVEADNNKLTELNNILNQVNSAITTKTENLNTEAGISARVKELKDERANVELNSTKYNELSKTIEKLESRLPKHTKAGSSEQKAEQLTEKQLQAEQKAEQSRIDVMEDGYAKRKAILDLQHKQNLARIDKEEKELEKARKDAGQGGLSSKEKGEFNERRDNENTSYTKDQNKLFDGEIEYKKSQYELYFRWVKNMGKDVAGEKFKDLLKSGSSYKDYLEKEIQRLNEKKANGSITDGEANNLINLNIQYDDVTGAKRAIDVFKNSVTQAINQASTLAEKMQILAEAKEKLQKGSAGLVGDDEKAAASLFLNQQSENTDKELQDKILSDFKTFEEKKTEIIQEYNLLRLQKQVHNNKELLARVNKGEADALSALNAEKLKSSQSWIDLFTNLNSLSAAQIEKLIANIETQMSESNLKLSPVDYNALIDSLNQAKKKLVSLNPFKELGTAFDNYIKATKNLKDAEKKNLSPDEINNLKRAVKDSANQMADSIASITDIVGTVGDAVSSIADSFGASDEVATDINAITGAMTGVGQTAGGVAKIMSGDLVGGITDVVSGIASVITNFNKFNDNQYEKQIKALQNDIDNLADSYENLADAIERAFSTTKADLIAQQNENLEKQNELIQQQIEAELSKKKTDYDKIKEWQDQIKENNKTIAENSKYAIIEAIMGTDISTAIDDFATAYADAWAAGEKAASKSANVVKNLIKTAIIEQLKNQLTPEVEAFMTAMSDALADGVISDAEQAMLDEYEKKLEDISDSYLSQTGSWLTDDSTSEDALSGAVKSVTEETASVVAGRLNAVVINQSEGLSVLRQSLIVHQQIAANTSLSASELYEIKSTLNDIKNSGNSLLSQGIGG